MDNLDKRIDEICDWDEYCGSEACDKCGPSIKRVKQLLREFGESLVGEDEPVPEVDWGLEFNEPTVIANTRNALRAEQRANIDRVLGGKMTAKQSAKQDPIADGNVVQSAQEVRVIELTGQKLDPNAKYLIAYDQGRVMYEEVGLVMEELGRMGIKATTISTFGDPREVLTVFEVMPPEALPNNNGSKLAEGEVS